MEEKYYKYFDLDNIERQFFVCALDLDEAEMIASCHAGRPRLIKEVTEEEADNSNLPQW